MFQNVLTQSAPENQGQDVFDCQGDDNSCISKEDEVMISGDRFGGADDHKNVTSGVASISSSMTKGFCDELNFNAPMTSVQNPRLQSPNLMHGDGSEELVDVRVCDICGDAGREMLLALCSKCNDGAEHIYCMTPKMDKVPENDWLCGECLLIREPKRHQQEDNASKSMFSKELSQGPLCTYTPVKHVGKTRKIHLSKSSGLSNKKRTIDQRVQTQKISGSRRQTRLTQVSSLKKIEKREDSADQVSSFVDLPANKVVQQATSSHRRSIKREQQFCGGSLNSLEVRCSREDINQRSSLKENAACELKKKRADKKVFKSLSNTQSSASTIKGLKCGSGTNSEKRSPENNTGELRQTSVVSKFPAKGANSSRKNVEDRKIIQVCGNTNVKPLGSLVNEAKNCINTIGAGSVKEKKSDCHSSYVVNSPDVNGDSNQRVSLSTQKAKFDDSDHSLASYKILPFDFQDLKVMPDIDHGVCSAISAVPESKCIWKGTFKLDESGKLSSNCYVQAHLSTHASSKVDELVFSFPTELQLMEVPRLLTWPVQFQKNHPTEQDIALYFFAQDLLSYQRSYRKLLEGMTSNDLALEANFGGFQLLIFPSSLLPVKSQCWNSLLYLWGVFRLRKLDDSYFPNLNISPLNQRLGSHVICGSKSKFVSPSVNGSAFVPPTSHNSMEGIESVDPVVLQPLATMKSTDQSGEHEVPSLEEDTLKEHHLQAGTTAFCGDWRFKCFERGLLSDELQKGRRISNEDVESVDIFRCSKSMPSIGFHSDDVASGSSLSLDSGPSGLSDSGWCAKSPDEVPFENLGSYNDALNLDLCLGNRSGSEDLDLDLTLGFPGSAYHQPKDYLKNCSDRDGKVSLILSLGMPCSNW